MSPSRRPGSLRLSNTKARSAFVCALLLAASGAACGKKAPPTSLDDAAASIAETTSGPVADAAVAGDDAGAPTGPRVYAIASPASIFNVTEFPARDPGKTSDDRKAAMLVGYLRKGDSAVFKNGPIKKGNCGEGWYELAVGGFICGKFVTTNANDPALADAPHPPFPQGPLPYDYGLNMTNGSPLYSQMPSADEEDKYEKGLSWDRDRKETAGDDQGSSDSTPWYLQHQSGKPTVKFGDLRGEGFPVEERMVRGFYVSLDKVEPGTFRRQRQRHEKFWHTVKGLFVREDHIMVHDVKVEFQGINLAAPGETKHLPLAFILGFHTHPQKIGDDQKIHHSSDHIDRFSIVQLTGKKQFINFHDYYEMADGTYLRDIDMTLTKPNPPPADLKPGEKWIDVDLAHQTLVAFEGDKPVYATMISSGKHNNDDPDKNHRTPSGDFRIREKHVSATMDDDGASDGTYSIEDVPWIMYFHGGYALHGAFWHSAWGHERSHGCINMTPTDARTIFGWVGPTLPDGWHGVHQTDANPGTRVIVHDEVLEKEKADRAKARAAGQQDAGEN
jgi:L,D-transpeptidase catalytic domain